MTQFSRYLLVEYFIEVPKQNTFLITLKISNI